MSKSRIGGSDGDVSRAGETAPFRCQDPEPSGPRGPSAVRFIDLDGLGCGGAEVDVGNLAVHLQLRAMQSGRSVDRAVANCQTLYETYSARVPLDVEILHSVEQHTWFRLGCLYLLRGQDQGSVSLLNRVER